MPMRVSTPNANSPMPGLQIADPEILPMRRGAERRHQAVAMQGLWHACTPEMPLGALMVSSEGACAAYYQYGDVEGLRDKPRRMPHDQASKPITRYAAARKWATACMSQGHACAWRRRQGDAGPHRRCLRHRLRQSASGPARRPGAFRFADLAPARRPACLHHRFLRGRSLVFPGGDIGKLAVCGTVNDLAVGGAKPLYLSCSVIIEEGIEVALLRKIARSMAATAREPPVSPSSPAIPRSWTAAPATSCSSIRPAIGVIRSGLDLGAHRAAAGRCGSGQWPARRSWRGHSRARGDLALDTPIESDCAALNGLIDALLDACPQVQVHPRSRRAAASRPCSTKLPRLPASASRSKSAAIPLREEVKGFCEILGLDPLYLANEGKIVAVVAGARGRTRVRGAWRSHPLGRGSRDHRPSRARPRRPRDDADPFRRQAHRRHAGRRAIAAYLLRRRRCMNSGSRDRSSRSSPSGRGPKGQTRDAGDRQARGVMPDAIRFCFDVVAQGSALDGAALDIVEIPGRARCRDCGARMNSLELSGTAAAARRSTTAWPAKN